MTIKPFSRAMAAAVLAVLCWSGSAQAVFITPVSANSLNTLTVGPASVLISDALDANYIAPNPASGGGGTSAWTSALFNTFTFNLASPAAMDTLYLWDYYAHTPTNWSLSFFDGSNGAGVNLGSAAFSIVVGPINTSTLHTINFAPKSGVLSAQLTNTNASVGVLGQQGVGLSEVHFGLTSVPVPPSVLFLGGGFFGLLVWQRRLLSARRAA